MKKIHSILSLVLLSLSLSAQAGVPGSPAIGGGFNKGPALPTHAPESCWSDPGAKKRAMVVDGSFNVSIQAESLSGKELVQILGAVERANSQLNPKDGLRLIALESTDSLLVNLSSVAKKGESREALMARANAVVEDLQALDGVSVRCNFISQIQGGLSGSN